MGKDKGDPEKLETKHSRIAVGLHTILAIIVGWLSIYISAVTGEIITVVIAIVVVILFGYMLEKFIGKKGLKWWMGNGIFIYILIWFVTWAFFLNTAL